MRFFRSPKKSRLNQHLTRARIIAFNRARKVSNELVLFVNVESGAQHGVWRQFWEPLLGTVSLPGKKRRRKKKTWHSSLEGKFRILGLESLGDFFHAKYAFFQENLKGFSVLSV